MTAILADKDSVHTGTRAVAVHIHALSPRVSEYIKLLSTKHPFMKDVVFDKRDALHELIGFWPDLPKWDVEARKIWAIIESTVLSVAAAGTNERMLLQIRANSGPLSSNVHTESDESMAMLAFDGARGNMKSFLVPPMGETPDLDAQHLLSGILVRCQPFPVLIGKEHDTHLYGSKAGALYTRRTVDNPLSTNTFRGKSSETERIEEESRTRVDFDNNARLAAIAALAALAIDDESLLEKTRQEAKGLEIKQKEEAGRLTEQHQAQTAPRSSPPVIDRAAVAVVALAESAPNIEDPQTDPAPAPVSEERDGSTEGPPSYVAARDAVPEESLNVSTDDPNDKPDDGNRVSTRTNESGFERRMIDGVLPVAVIVAPVVTLVSMVKRVRSAPTVITTPQAVKAKEPKLAAVPSPPTPILHDLSIPSKQEDGAHPLPQTDRKAEVSLASIDSRPSDKTVPILDAVAGALAVSSVDLAEPSGPTTQEAFLPEEPHRPMTASVEKVDTKNVASAEESSVAENVGSLEIVHFLASSDRTTNDEAKPPVTSSAVGKVANETHNDIHPQSEILSKTQTQEAASLEAGMSLPSRNEVPLAIHGAINAANLSERANASLSLEPTIRQSNPIEPIAEGLLHLAAINRSAPYDILKNVPTLTGESEPVATRLKSGRIKKKTMSSKKQSTVKKRILKKKGIHLLTGKGLSAILTIDS